MVLGRALLIRRWVVAREAPSEWRGADPSEGAESVARELASHYKRF